MPDYSTAQDPKKQGLKPPRHKLATPKKWWSFSAMFCSQNLDVNFKHEDHLEAGDQVSQNLVGSSEYSVRSWISRLAIWKSIILACTLFTRSNSTGKSHQLSSSLQVCNTGYTCHSMYLQTILQNILPIFNILSFSKDTYKNKIFKQLNGTSKFEETWIRIKRKRFWNLHTS